MVALLIVRLDSLHFMRVLGRVGLGEFHELFLWLIGLSFGGFVVYAQKKWRWTGFTLGVGAGIVLTLLGFGIFFMYAFRGSDLH